MERALPFNNNSEHLVRIIHGQKRFLPELLTGMVELNTMNMENKPSLTKIGRDAKTGRFIPVKEAERRPKTTVVEKIRRGK